jgi:hypothetical protein
MKEFCHDKQVFGGQFEISTFLSLILLESAAFNVHNISTMRLAQFHPYIHIKLITINMMTIIMIMLMKISENWQTKNIKISTNNDEKKSIDTKKVYWWEIFHP